MLRYLVLTCCCAALLHAQADQELDHSGVDWTRPFPDAQKEARAEGRLLLIKPIAFGTNAKGCW